MAGVPGAWVERKRFAIAVHYRQTPPDRHGAVQEAVSAVAPEFPRLRVSSGKMILELRPGHRLGQGQGAALAPGADGAGPAGVLPMYLGDDTTDEDAFRAISGWASAWWSAPAPAPRQPTTRCGTSARCRSY